jgi:hypothetical protein
MIALMTFLLTKWSILIWGLSQPSTRQLANKLKKIWNMQYVDLASLYFNKDTPDTKTITFHKAFRIFVPNMVKEHQGLIPESLPVDFLS